MDVCVPRRSENARDCTWVDAEQGVTMAVEMYLWLAGRGIQGVSLQRERANRLKVQTGALRLR